MILQDRILELLKGRSQHKPLIGDDLLAKTGADPDEVNDALDDLQGRGALNRAEITRGDRTFTALWPTGLVPRALSWKDERNNGKGLMGAQLAHSLQQDAERSRNTSKPVPTPVPTPIKETPMVRVARPAQVVETPAEKPVSKHARKDEQKNTGAVQQAVLAALREGGRMDVESIFSQCTVQTSLGSVGKTLETLAKRGEVVASLQFHNHRNRRFYCLPGFVPEADGAVDHDHDTASTIATLRRMSADDPIADAGKMVDPADVDPAVFEADAPVTRAAAVAGLESDAARFALWDTGALLITIGDEIIALPAPEARRLATYLRGVSGALFAEAA